MTERIVGKNMGNAGKGRPKGSPNKATALLKDAILAAAEAAGDSHGMTGYLEKQARANPVAFLSLLGKVLPMQIGGDPENPLSFILKIGGERVSEKR